MKRTPAFLAITALCVAALSTKPVTAATVDVEVTYPAPYAPTFSFDVSDLWLGAFNIANISVMGLGSTRLIEDPLTGALTVNAFTESAHLTYDDESQAVYARSLKSGMGILLNSPPSSIGKRSSGDFPGWLTLSNIEVDLDAGAVYADIAGDHGLIPRQRQHMWSFDVATSASAPNLSRPGSVMVSTVINGLGITDEGFDLFIQGIGLSRSAFGQASLRGITDYGGIRTQIGVTIPVPEPSAWAMHGLGLAGLLGLGWAGRRRRLP